MRLFRPDQLEGLCNWVEVGPYGPNHFDLTNQNYSAPGEMWLGSLLLSLGVGAHCGQNDQEFCASTRGSRLQPLLQPPLWSVPHRREVCTAGHGIRPSGQPTRLPAAAQRRAGSAPAIRPADLRGGMATPFLLERTACFLWVLMSFIPSSCPHSCLYQIPGHSPIGLTLNPYSFLRTGPTCLFLAPPTKPTGLPSSRF